MAQNIHLLYWFFVFLTLFVLVFSHADINTMLDQRKQGERQVVRGRVYCDLCSAGRVTLFTNFIQGARVGIRCRNSNGNQALYYEAVTDSNGWFDVNIDGYHEQHRCVAELRSSSDISCNITTENSISFVNGSGAEHTVALAFSPVKTPKSCAELSDLHVGCKHCCASRCPCHCPHPTPFICIRPNPGSPPPPQAPSPPSSSSPPPPSQAPMIPSPPSSSTPPPPYQAPKIPSPTSSSSPPPPSQAPMIPSPPSSSTPPPPPRSSPNPPQSPGYSSPPPPSY